MTVTCPTCNASLTIPDERLPKGKVVTAACPQCKGKIVIDLTGSAPEPATAGVPAGAAPGPSPEEPGEYGAQGKPRALVCVAGGGERDQILAALKREGYAAQAAADAEEAKEGLRFSDYALVILRDGFGSAAGDGNPVLEHIAEMGTPRRRHILVVFVSPNVRSHDAAVALAKSVNLVLNISDLPHLAEAVKGSRVEMEQQYRVLLESLRAMGKG